MLTKTIALELLTASGALHERLKRERKLLATVDLLAAELKRLHLEWIAQLSEGNSTEDPRSISSRASELAIEELRMRISPGDSADGDGAFDLDSAMAFLMRPTPPA
jgi:cell division protein FtsL